MLAITPFEKLTSSVGIEYLSRGDYTYDFFVLFLRLRLTLTGVSRQILRTLAVNILKEYA
ncbi:MAG: hypothetical protein ACI936_002371 [Paraglaciecola sp.]|jgi:hypothetical protein